MGRLGAAAAWSASSCTRKAWLAILFSRTFHIGSGRHAGGVVGHGTSLAEELIGLLLALVLTVVLITVVGERIW